MGAVLQLFPLGTLLMVAFHMMVVFHLTQGKTEEQEAGMSKDEYNFRIERIKQEILRKLDMKAPPKPSLKRDKIPTALIDDFLRDIKEREDNAMKSSKKIIALAQKAKMTACGTEKCLRVSFNQSLRQYKVHALDIWLYKEAEVTPPGTFKVYQMHGGKRKLLQEVSGEKSGSSSGWVTHNIADFNKWITGEGSDAMISLTLLISCQGCTMSDKNKKLPFLVVTTESNASSRVRRVTGECDSKKRCCLKPFKVDFKELEWDEFIITPEAFDAKFCDGTCPINHQWPNEHMGLVRIVKKDFQSCCNPKEYQPLDILYLEEDGNIIQKTIPNMKVSKCRCS